MPSSNLDLFMATVADMKFTNPKRYNLVKLLLSA